MAFISTIPENEAEGSTRELYDAVTARFGFVPNLARVFSHRPEVWQAWNTLLESIRSQLDPRRYELVTLAAAQELRNSYCMLAHGTVLARDFYDGDAVKEIVSNPSNEKLDEIDTAIMQFARMVVRDASSITQSDVNGLKAVGLTDAEIFDVASAAAFRCFFSKTLDALGAQPDAAYNDIDESLKEALTVGRPIEQSSARSL